MTEKWLESVKSINLDDPLVNVNDGIAKRVAAEHKMLTDGLKVAEKRHLDIVNSYNATFAYRVSLILADPTVSLPPLPHESSEVVE